VEHLEQLIVDLKDSLERELGGMKQDLHEGLEQIQTRFDTQGARLDRQAGLWQTGARWSRRMDDWAEKVDRALESKDREISELRERLARLERKAG